MKCNIKTFEQKPEVKFSFEQDFQYEDVMLTDFYKHTTTKIEMNKYHLNEYDQGFLDSINLNIEFVVEVKNEKNQFAGESTLEFQIEFYKRLEDSKFYVKTCGIENFEDIVCNRTQDYKKDLFELIKKFYFDFLSEFKIMQ